MSAELYWLTLTALMTGLMWVPYILNRFMELGILTTIFDKTADPTPKKEWAQNMMKAHVNAGHNLAVFAPLALVVHVAGVSTAATVLAVKVYFFARLAHYLVYTLGVPGGRTVAFLIGVGCQITLAMAVLCVH